MKKANELLQDAASIMTERGKQYDKPDGERSMGKTVQMFNICTGRDLRESEGWLLLELLKDVRNFTGKNHHEDSLLDGIAYSALKAEAAFGERAVGIDLAAPGGDRSVYVSRYVAENGWIEWKGGKCPVSSDSRVEVKYRDGTLHTTQGFNVLRSWKRNNAYDDIIAYRVIETPAPAVPAEEDGWIEWKGGECPVPSDARVETRLRNGTIASVFPAWIASWKRSHHFHQNTDEYDIIAYRVTK